MIYDRLSVIFLSTIRTEKYGSTNSYIARYLLEHPDEVRDCGIREIAEKCNVSPSSISRFCNETGFENFAELRQLLSGELRKTEMDEASAIYAERLSGYHQAVADALEQSFFSLPEEAVASLCSDIHSYRKVAAFGLMKAEAAAINLQGDLLHAGKSIYTNVSYHEQLSYIQESASDDLILIFSYTGSYFEGRERAFINHPGKGKIWMISGSTENIPSFVHHTLVFHSDQTRASHPWQLLSAADVISREYIHRYVK